MLGRRALGLCAGLLALAAVPQAALAQPAPDGLKPIGVPAHAAQEIEPALIVLIARGATLSGSTLTLHGPSPNAIIFADRPVRAAGHALTAHLLEEWAIAGDSFAKDPPNATVSVVNKDATVTKDAVVVLTAPRMDGDNLTFTVKVLEGDLAGADGPAAVFIDIIGLPFTPLSFAGVARRTARRTAFYAAAAHPYPYGYPPHPACGYYPYPPCY